MIRSIRAVALTALFAGCTEPRVGPSRDEDAASRPPVHAPSALLTSSASSDARGLAPAAQACATDADCRTVSSYCRDAPCFCRVLGRNDRDPTCGAGPVNCLADPCMRKTAACQGGRCELVVDPAR